MPKLREDERATETGFEDWLNADETAAWLGISKRSLNSNNIPCAEIGGLKVYCKTDVARWLEKRRDQ